ncbi:MAG: DNA translocase FtsK 4TM domain-containing protein, partial [Clostridiales bacterium]|nr:DNA translocase FtsK 4TM domain-containing protein [Clostridiales bacterium]
QKKKPVKKGKKKRPSLFKEVVGILVIMLGVLIFFGVFFEDSTGAFGRITVNLLSGLLGWTYHLFPFLIIALGIFLIFTSYEINWERRSWLILLILLLIACFLQLAYMDKNPNAFKDFSFFRKFQKFYEYGTQGETVGGVFGAIITNPMIAIFGIAGTYVVLIAFSLIDIILVTNASFREFFIRVKNGIKAAAKWMLESFKPIDNQMGSKEKKKTTKRVVKKELQSEEPYRQQRFKLNNTKKQIDFSVEDSSGKEDVSMFGEGTEAPEKRKRAPRRTKKVVEKEKIATAKVAASTAAHIKETAPRINSKGYIFPPLNLLDDFTYDDGYGDNCDQIAELLEETLESFGVVAKVVNYSKGPTVTRYELQPKSGVKVSRITNLADDIALNLAARDVRIEAPVPGKAVVGIEVPNKEKAIVPLKEILSSKEFINHESPVAIAIGKDIGGKVMVADVRKMPHMLIAGATGSGKSVAINCIITSILYKSSPEDVKLLMIDPKKVELGNYNGIPHLLIPVVNNVKKAAGALNWAVTEMTGRYDKFSAAGVRDVDSYNKKMEGTEDVEKMPQILIIIDELADLMAAAPGEVEESICRLAQLARAAGMHLIIATQRPSVNVITGLIKANIPSRVAFSVVSQVDSRTIIDMAGAEKLLGMGDMLFHPIGLTKPIRVQGAYIGDHEIAKITKFIRDQGNEMIYDEDIIEKINVGERVGNGPSPGDADVLLPRAIEEIMMAGQASVSYIQRKLKVGYARAARIVDQMEERGIVGPFEGSKPRQLMISREEWEEMKMQNPEDY